MRGGDERALMGCFGFRKVSGGDGGAAGEHVLCVIGKEPVARLRDADGDDFVFLLVDGGKHGGGGAERDLVLAGAAAEDDPNAEFAGHRKTV